MMDWIDSQQLIILGIFFSLIAGFILAWKFMPDGWLTIAWTGFQAFVVGAAEFLDMLRFMDWKSIMPADYVPWLMLLFLVLTMASRMRSRIQDKPPSEPAAGI